MYQFLTEFVTFFGGEDIFTLFNFGRLSLSSLFLSQRFGHGAPPGFLHVFINSGNLQLIANIINLPV